MGIEERYPSASNASKNKQREAKKKKVEKVVKGSVTTKKQSGIKKFSDVFLAEDWANVGSYILKDIIIPNAQNFIVEIVRNGIEMAVYGETKYDRSRSGGPKIAYTDYSKPTGYRNNRPANQGRNGYSFDELIIPSYSDADEVLTRMDELIEEYEMASVADLYNAAGITPPYTAYNYGWTDIRSAQIVRVRGGGYTIKMPRALPLK